MFKKAFSVSVAKPNVRRRKRGIAVKSLRIGGPGYGRPFVSKL